MTIAMRQVRKSCRAAVISHTAAFGRRASTLVPVLERRQVVDYALQRRTLLGAVSRGRTAIAEVCDADPYLLRAARFHGHEMAEVCPICRKGHLTLVSWVFGERLGAVTGTARTSEELERLAVDHEEFTVHEVEVCRSCRWNHLVQSFVLGRGPRPAGRRRTAGG